MHGLLARVQGTRRVLAAVAAPAEARAVLVRAGADPGLAAHAWELHPLGDRLDLLVTGVGKANAAGAVSRLLDPDRHAGVVNLGVAGALPGAGLELGAVVVAHESVYADEGLLLPDGRFVDCGAMGFPLAPPLGVRFPGTPAWISALEPLGVEAGLCGVATVSTCSGSDDLAARVRGRTGAGAEAMEGAAVGQAVARLGTHHRATLGFAEVRVISNTTGDRPGQRWDLAGALARLGDVLGQI